MKITTLLLFCVVFHISASMYAQDNKVSINKKNSTIIDILKEIEESSEVTFFFNDNHVNAYRKTSINVQNVSLEQALDEIFRGTGYEYQIIKNQVLIRASASQAPGTVQQGKTIIGTVVDSAGEPIIGANVLVKGHTIGAITDINGRFTLSVPENAVLVVSYIGYVTAEVPVGNRTSLSVELNEDALALEEVIVVGYGTVRKKDLTGAVGAIKGDDLAARRTTQLSTALQGAIAGVQVTRDSNSPSATSTIRVRGVTTLSSNDPLVIVDGVPGNLNDVNPNDVESMSVLKDAASASIYGARAAAGVILITTKRANENDLSLGYSFEYGFEIPTRQPEYVGIQRYLETTNELRYNDNTSGGWFQTYSEDQVNNWVKNHATDPNNYPITDWKDLILKKSAPRQTHTINVSGGNKTVKTKVSFVYDHVDGLYAERYYERFMIRANNDIQINKYLGATLDLSFRRSKNHEMSYNPFSKIRIAAPTYPAMWEDGRIASGKNGDNPYAMTLHGGYKDVWSNQLRARASLDFSPVDGLKISGVIAPTYNFIKSKAFRKAIPYTLADDPNTIGGYMEDFNTTKLTEDRDDNYNVTIQALATYIKRFGLHDINLMAGYENYYEFNEYLMASRDQYELNNFPYLDIGPKTLRDNTGNANQVAYRSWFGRFMYNYNNRYLLQANVRYDGSSRFHPDHRWGAFPSVSAGWVISEETFMKNLNLNWLSFLKLRASWGRLGNERIGSYYPYQSNINFGNTLFYKNGQVASELTAAQWKYAIENITWETTESYDFGLDAHFFDDRLRLSADYYKKTTKDMLLALEIPDYVGFDNPEKNTGDMYTTGWDLELGWNDRIGDFSYAVNVNLSDYVSKMGNLGGTQFLGDMVKMEGSQFDEWYGYLSDGLFLTQEDLDNSPKMNNNVKVGDLKYKDISGPDGVPDGLISPEYDRVLLGGSTPRYAYGGKIQLGYKGIDLGITVQGIGKQNSRIHATMIQPLAANWGNTPAIIDGKYWSEKNTPEQNAAARYPRLTVANQYNNYQAMTDYWMFNGRYLRLKNLTIGYTIPSWLTQKVTIKHARVYVSANDLFCLSNYPKGWDPEMGLSSYPITTSLLFGLSVNF